MRRLLLRAALISGEYRMSRHLKPASARLAASISMALLAPIALAADTDWQALDGDWFTAGNWSAGLPGLLDTARIDNAGVVRIAAPGALAQALIIGDSGSGFVELAEGGVLDVGAGTGIIELARGVGSIGKLTISGDSAGTIRAGQIHGGSGSATLEFAHADSGHDFFTAITGSVAVNHVGSGSTSLYGEHSYSGNTRVDAGQLFIEGSIVSNTFVGDGGTLGGSGAIMAMLTVEDGGILNAGRADSGPSIGLLTVGELFLNEDALLRFDLNAPDGLPGSDGDVIRVAAGLNGSSGDLVLDGVLQINGLASFGMGSYRLFEYDGTLTDNALRIGGIPVTFDPAQFFIQTGVNGQVNLIVGDATGVQFWDGGGVAGDGVIEGGSGVWDNANRNFSNADGSLGLPWRGAMAVFNGEGGTITLADDVSFESLQFASDGYVIEAGADNAFGLLADFGVRSIRVDIGSTASIAAAIRGEGILEKTYFGTLVLSGENSYSGGTIIRQGELRVDAGAIRHADAGMSIGEFDGDEGVLSIRNAGVVEAAFARLAEGHDSLGVATVSGAGSQWLLGEDISVGMQGAGILQVSDGGSLRSTGLYAGERDGSSGEVQINGVGSQIVSDADVFIGVDGDGLLALHAGGTLDVMAGAGTLHLGSGAGSGQLVLGDGGLAGTLAAAQVLGGNNASVVFNHADADYQFNTVLAGALDVNVRGTGSTTLTADNTFTGITRIDAGRLLVNGRVGDVQINAGGILGGTGRVGNVGVNAGALLNPGDGGIGALLVDGALTFTEGSLLQVDVAADGSGDHLQVSGTTRIDGGAVQVLAGPGEFAYETRYTLIDSVAGLSGQFDGVSSNLAFFSSSLSYDGNRAFLVLQRNATAFADLAQTFNQRAVGNAFDQLQASNPRPVLDVINAFAAASGEQAVRGLEAVSGDAAAQSAALRLAWEQRHFTRVLDRLGPARAGATRTQAQGFWVQGEADSGSLADANAGDADYDSGGFALGYDRSYGERWRGGFSLGLAKLNGDVSSRRADLREESVRISGYSAYDAGALSVAAMAGIGFGETRIERDVRIGSVDFGRSRGDSDNTMVMAAVQASYTFTPRAAWVVSPLLALDVAHLDRQRFAERGAGQASLDYSGLQHTSVRSRLGFASSAVATLGDAKLRPRMSLLWQHEYGDRALDQRVAFAAIAEQRFTVRSTERSRDQAVLGLGLDGDASASWSWFVDVTATLGAGDEDYSASAGMRYRF
ncbi:MAG: hypothetical protein CVV12_02900 [Gammaproteobacteria bacterium HGW-Gammaproteobacteria-2]|jgi:T5SS/PEP-CTERM-associated repeat protein/autotransporter-associated beta strand protein|nr:MAG: hypothetical protein CVV12_02900 [Gammaproteobacteria bacterium HGW-Gammaproteobacteria-2]